MKTIERYVGFADKNDMACSFAIDIKELENCEILLAVYEQEAYEGWAFVLFEKDHKLYEVNGSHCRRV